MPVPLPSTWSGEPKWVSLSWRDANVDCFEDPPRFVTVRKEEECAGSKFCCATEHPSATAGGQPTLETCRHCAKAATPTEEKENG